MPIFAPALRATIGHSARVSDPIAEHAELLTPPGNFAIVQLPGRKFPGVVFQGDSLSALCEQATLVAEQAANSSAADDAIDLRDQLNEVLRWYISVVEQRGIRAPFEFRPPAE